jgi:hypothetical protein
VRGDYRAQGLLGLVVLVHLAASRLLSHRLLSHPRRHRLGRVNHFWRAAGRN